MVLSPKKEKIKINRYLSQAVGLCTAAMAVELLSTRESLPSGVMYPEEVLFLFFRAVFCLSCEEKMSSGVV